MRALTDVTSEALRRWRESQGWDVPRMARELRKVARDSGEDVAAHHGLDPATPEPAESVVTSVPTGRLAGSALMYVLAWNFDWNLPAYPNGVWFFNPFAWQLLFVFGAWCALGGAQRLSGVLRSPFVLTLAIAYLLFAFAITMTWYIEPLQRFVPQWLSDWMYPIDKTNLDVLRFAHFLALAAVTVRRRSSGVFLSLASGTNMAER